MGNSQLLDIFGEPTGRTMEFPTTDKRLSALGYYIENIDEFVSWATDQTHIREKNKIESLDDPVDQGEREGALDEMIVHGRYNFESIIFGSTLVGIYSTFESTISQIFEYCSDEFSLKEFVSYKKELYPKRSFPFVASMYSSEVLKLPLFCDSISYQGVEILRKLRNSFVHNGSLLGILDTKLRDSISNSKSGKVYFSSDELRWHITKHGLILFFNQINSTVDAYTGNARRKYA